VFSWPRWRLLARAHADVGPSVAGPVLAIATPIGTIFVNLIRMTVIRW
jgi:hypothetical protein